MEIREMIRWLAIVSMMIAFLAVMPACGGTSGGGGDHDDDDDPTPTPTKNTWGAMLWDDGEWQ